MKVGMVMLFAKKNNSCVFKPLDDIGNAATPFWNDEEEAEEFAKILMTSHGSSSAYFICKVHSIVRHPIEVVKE